ncbi:hypothetical protein Ahy_A01g001386 isoform A [Arachis hypogaea]|uniref:Uncharacterized protein n=1 Tax=Arachis hypogaea TaxID=3818 RepID=A0A445EN32_ARAHY|nr:hypothetical protein Ahy_A01g001386 isoform A [Arachis hypogaea]
MHVLGDEQKCHQLGRSSPAVIELDLIAVSLSEATWPLEEDWGPLALSGSTLNLEISKFSVEEAVLLPCVSSESTLNLEIPKFNVVAYVLSPLCAWIPRRTWRTRPNLTGWRAVNNYFLQFVTPLEYINNGNHLLWSLHCARSSS